MKVKKVDIPDASLLVETRADYKDSFQAEFADNKDTIDIVTITKTFFSTSPRWVGKLFVLRNKIVSVFGLKTRGQVTYREELLNNFKGQVGEQVGIFKVFSRADNEIVLGEDDHHLNFRVSLLLEKAAENRKYLTISTTVIFNNWFGSAYFLPVKPFHKFIVPAMLKSVIKEVER